MFEYDQQIVESLLEQDNDFKRLYNKHHLLNQHVDEANSGCVVMDQLELETLKKEKLLIKDQMADMIEHYRRTHT